MPDLINFSVTPQSAANVNVPRFTVSCQVVDSGDQNIVLADFTGANVIQFPSVMSTLSAAQRREILELIVHRLIQMKAGLE